MPKTDPKVPRHNNKPTHLGVGDRIATNPGPQPGKIKWVHLWELWHLKIKALMNPVMAKVGNSFAIWDILRGSNVLIKDLPILQKYQDNSGCSTILLDKYTLQMHLQGLSLQTTRRTCSTKWYYGQICGCSVWQTWKRSYVRHEPRARQTHGKED